VAENAPRAARRPGKAGIAMNVLITNTQEDQAYLILSCLTGHVGRIVVTMEGSSSFKRWSGMSPWSRHVSKRYPVPDCAADWRAGTIQRENTPAEERYLQRIEEICALERIDVIFPSYDAEVYVLSKNRERLARAGVTAVAPDFESVSRVIDKSLTLAAAERVGFPIPRTRIPSSLEEAKQAARELEPPWVLKPRCNAHGVNILLARDEDELEQVYRRLEAVQERPLMQEYVAAETKRNFYLLVDRDSNVRSVFTPKVHRTRKTGMNTPCAAVESTREVPYETEMRALLKEVGIWGGMTLQTIVDIRDGRPKLMEINPRFGHNLWYRTELGINEPLMLLKMAQGLDPGPVPPFEEGVLLLDPLWDGLHLLGQSVDQSIARLRGKRQDSESNGEPYEAESLGPLAADLRAEYFGPGRRVTSPLNRGYLKDPVPPLTRIVRVFVEALQRRAS
jgi:glutathione synthase/RimK-type ligase-like ATP-grasp enzyme